MASFSHCLRSLRCWGPGRERASGTTKAPLVARSGFRRLVQCIGCSLRNPRHRLRVWLVERLAASLACRRSPRALDRVGLDVARRRPSWPQCRFRSDRRVSALGRHRDTYRRHRRDRSYPWSTAATRHMHLIHLDQPSNASAEPRLGAFCVRCFAVRWAIARNSFGVTRSNNPVQIYALMTNIAFSTMSINRE